MARKRFRKSEGLSPLLVRLIEAAEHSGEDAEGRDIRGAAQALREFGQLAEWALPIHGVFVANNKDVSTIVERVAKQHWIGRALDERFVRLSKRWSRSISAIQSNQRRTIFEPCLTRRTSTLASRSASRSRTSQTA